MMASDALTEDHSPIRSSRFRRERESGWRELEKLVARSERSGGTALDFSEVQLLAMRYSEAVNALSVAREVSLDAALIDYLEALCARAYLAVYAPPKPIGGVVARFMHSSGPRALRKGAIFILTAAITMLLGALVGYGLYFEDNAWYYTILPGEMMQGRNPDASAAELRQVIYSEADEHSGLGAFASFLFSHNTRVAIFAFGLGVVGCAPAIIILFYNGLTLGAFVALHVDRGLGPDIFGWLSIHGVTELSAIIIAGGAGLMIGWAALFPGPFRRGDAMRKAGESGVKMLVVAALMLFLAAILEGFGRQLIQTTETRLIIGWSIGAIILSWAFFAGRASSEYARSS